MNYTCKYISKEQEKIGGRWYYSGGDLRKPDVILADVDYDSFCDANRDSLSTFSSGGIEFVTVTF